MFRGQGALLYSPLGFVLSSQRVLLQVLPSCGWESPLTLVVCLPPGMVVHPGYLLDHVHLPQHSLGREKRNQLLMVIESGGPQPFGTRFCEDGFPVDWGGGDGFGMTQAHYICCVLYSYYYYINSTSDHRALDPRV